MTLGMPSTKMLKLQAKESWRGGGAEELLHELVRVGAPLQVNGQLQTRQVGLIPHVGHLPDLAQLDELGHLVQDGLGGGGVGESHKFQ